MAKGKRTSALFDVIQPDKPLNQQARRGLFGRLLGTPAGARAAATTREARPAATARKIQPPPPTAPLPPVQKPNVELDSDRGELRVRMSYTTAIVGGFAVATVVAGAFLVGQKLSSARPRPAAGLAAPEVQQQAPRGEVLDLQRQVTNVDVPIEIDNGVAAAGATDLLRGDRNRTVGLNYVIVQSYPAAEEQMAQDAVKLLIGNGIDATIEKDVPGWSSRGWLTVMGTVPFARISADNGRGTNPQLEAYMRKIKQISDDAHAKTRSFKAFDPRPYKWVKQ